MKKATRALVNFWILLLTAACGRSQGKASDDLLGIYAPGLHLNETVGQALSRGAHLVFVPGRDTNFGDTTLAGIDGFQSLTIRLELPEYDQQPALDSRIQGVALESRSQDSFDRATRRLTETLGNKPLSGCVTTRNGRILSKVRLWPGRDATIVLESIPTQGALFTVLTIQQPRWSQRLVHQPDCDS